MAEESRLKKMLDVGRAPRITPTVGDESYRLAEFSLSKGTIEVPQDAPEGDALSFLEQSGQNPDVWEVTGFRRLHWGSPEDPKVSVRFTYKRREGAPAGERVSIDDLLDAVNDRVLVLETVDRLDGPDSAAVLIGDHQFGKGIDDPLKAVEHALSAIDRAAEEIAARGPMNDILVAWLGDHVEGFVSQGGANTWRTRLTLSEQLRLTRRVMLYAAQIFSPLCDHLTMAAVPGNHGEPQRFQGKGVTTYDDNHDVECLNAVAEACSMSQDLRDVEFLVPERDHISMVVEVGGVRFGLVHGDRWRAGKHFDWWRKQTFGGMPLASADVLACGHWHHWTSEQEGGRLFIQVPALEAESQWYAHQQGVQGQPGCVIAWINSERVEGFTIVRAD